MAQGRGWPEAGYRPLYRTRNILLELLASRPLFRKLFIKQIFISQKQTQSSDDT